MLSIRKLSIALAAIATAVSGGAFAAAPAPYGVTPELIKAAQNEGKVVFYTSIELKIATKLGQAFEAKYPGVKVQIERNGAERNFQRIYQEFNAGIHNGDVVESSDAMNFLYWKKQGWLATGVPTDVAKWPADEKDPDGKFAVVRATLSVMGYNPNLVKADQAPKSYADLLKPEWKGKIVKAHPAYSGTIMTETYVLSHLLGWDYFEKLAKQDVLQVQSATVPSQKVAQGERAIMEDGVEYVLLVLEESGAPVRPIYPTEGSPLIEGNAAMFDKAPHPNAAKLFYHFIFSQPAQQLLSDEGGIRSFHPDVKEKADRKPLSEIKLLHSDPAAIEKEVQMIKNRYQQYFGT